MVVIGQSGCNRAKVVVFGQSGCIRRRWVYLSKSGCNWENVVLSGKVVLFG